MKVKVTQLCPTFCDPHGLTSLPGSSVHGLFQVRILDWVASPFSRGSSQPRNRNRVSYTAGRFFTKISNFPSFPPWCPYMHSLHLCLYFCFADRFIGTIFLTCSTVP